MTALLVASCGGGSITVDDAGGTGRPDVTATGTVVATSTSVPTSTDGNRPPDLRVTGGDRELVLSPFSYCWSAGGTGVCADGLPPDPLPSLSLVDSALSVSLPIDWTLQATVSPSGGACDDVSIIDVDPGGAPFDVPGSAGTYRLDLFGRGDRGDGAWAFQVATGADAPDVPRYVQAFWYPAGGELPPDAPFSVVVGNLAERPGGFAASVTVTPSSGATGAFDLHADTPPDCWSSSLRLDAPEDFTERVSEIGPPPYEFAVTVDIDGTTVSSESLTWPDDFPDDSNESRRVRLGSG